MFLIVNVGIINCVLIVYRVTDIIPNAELQSNDEFELIETRQKSLFKFHHHHIDRKLEDL